MRRISLTKPTPLIAGLLSGLLLAILAVPLGAQPVSGSHVRQGFGPVYDAAHEITLNGNIEQVITKRMVGSPAGMHLMVAGPKGLVDAHVGPFLSKEIKEALHTGTPVEIVGAMTLEHGKKFLLAREVNVGGSTFTVRNKRGLLVRVHAARTRPTKIAKKASALNGGAR
jgi:hypothetical protein